VLKEKKTFSSHYMKTPQSLTLKPFMTQHKFNVSELQLSHTFPLHRTISSASSIQVGAYYPLEMLPDHRGDYFQHEHAKLLQHEIFDVDDKLIPPWEMYKNLKIRTVILVETTLICWHIPDCDGSGSGGSAKKIVRPAFHDNFEEFTVKKKLQIYQIQGHRLRILSESDEPIETREPPILIHPSTESTSSTSPRKKPSSAFADFQSPAKKIRHD